MIPNEQKSSIANGMENFDLNKTISSYTKHWKWFVLSCLVCAGLAFVKLRYTTPEFNAQAKIMVIDDGRASNPAASVLQGLGQFGENDGSNIEDEIEVLKSRTLMEGVVKKLSLAVQYYMKGRVHETELFPNTPIKINFFVSDSIINKSRLNFDLYFKSETSFGFKIGEDELVQDIDFGEKIETPIGDIVITPNIDDISSLNGQNLFVSIKPVDEIATYYKEKVSIFPIQKFSKVIGLSLNDPVLEKSKQIINTLIDEYNRVSIDEKTFKSQNTADFINERINLIASDLSAADDKVEQFKTGNRLTNITSEAELYLNSSSETEQELADTETQLNLISYMKGYLSDDSGFEAIPSNVGLSDPAINNLALRYNDLLANRNNLLKGSTKSKNPIIVNLDNQLRGLRQSLTQSLNSSSKALDVRISDLKKQSSQLNSKIYSIPGQVRKSRDIERQQGTIESLYLYLLEKREEATIALASTSPKAKVIDKAYSVNDSPVSPKSTLVYLASIIIGLFIPFGAIYVKDLLDTKLHNKEDLEKVIKNMTVLGEIPKIKAKNNADTVIKRNDRSILSESFRIIRTNFDYVSKTRNVNEYSNIIFVTSTVKGEGKSFFSINMALTMANTDKRVLLIGADIRNPRTHLSLKGVKNNPVSKIGLTEYLSDKSIIVGEAIDTYEVKGNQIDVMLSGEIPPNPAELLMSDRMKLLFDKVSEQYDYVIVDTAPSMLVTDTLLFSQYAGHTIYMTRADYTEKRILNFAQELHDNKKLNNMLLVVNGVDQSNFGYGARYGYSRSKDKKSWFTRKQA